MDTRREVWSESAGLAWAGRAASLRVLLVGVLAMGACESSTSPVNTNPTAVIVANPNTLKSGSGSMTIVALSARGSLDPDGDRLSFSWSVSDGVYVEGTSASDDSVRVRFSGASPETVVLSVVDSRGGRDLAEVILELGSGLTNFQKDYVEALFLGSGPLVPRDGAIACMGAPGRWTAFPAGSNVDVLVSSTIGVSLWGEDTQQFLRDALADIAGATGGWLHPTFVPTNEADPVPMDGQVSSTDHPDPISQGCSFDRGCVLSGYRDPGLTTLSWARAVQRESIQPADAIVHDVVGHGIMGLCHIDQALIGGSQYSLMAGGPGAFSGAIADKLSESDLVAVRAVYGAGLSVGARRADFLEADLVNPD